MKDKKPQVHYIYKTTSQFWIYDDRAIIHMHAKMLIIILGSFMIILAIALLTFSILLVHSDFSINICIVILIFWGIEFTLNRKGEILVKEKKFVSKTYFNRFCIYTDEISWDETDDLKFIIKTDSYDLISGTTLIVRKSKEKNNITLMEFRDERFFFIFHKKFNEKFPDVKIHEWFEK